MNPQDIALGLFAAIVLFTLVWGTSGPRHRGVHNLLIVIALMTPFISFDMARASELPTEVWIFCGAYVVGHSASSATHYIWPESVHGRGSEAIMQSTFAVWAAVIRTGLDPSLWYRGTLGTVLFCTATIWVTLSVLTTLYQAELTGHARDEFDIMAKPLNTKSNAAILTCTPPTLLLALYVALQNPLFIAAAFASWGILRAVLRPDPTTR